MMNSLRIVFLSLLFASPGCVLLRSQTWKFNAAACSPSENQEAEKWIKKAEKSKIPGEQRMFLRNAVEEAPNYYEAHFQLARKAWLAQRYDECLGALEAVAARCPDYSPYTYFFMGKILGNSGKLLEAVAALEKFLSFEEISDESYEEAKRLLADWKKEGQLKKAPVPFSPELVHQICTEKDEYSASLSPDNHYIYFTRKELRQPKGAIAGGSMEPRGIEIFYRSQKNADGSWHKGEEMPRPFNMEYTNGAATLTADNKNMYFVVCANNEQAACDIWQTHWDQYRWAPLRNLGGVINSQTWDSQPTVSYDGNTMIFSSLRAGGMGGSDLYLSTRDALGKWSPPENLGKVINSDKNELTPFLHSDSQTLYFSSQGHDGLGGYDIYYSRRNPDGSWEKPVNIGYPINTEGDEVSFFVSLDGKTGFFSTNSLKLPDGKEMGMGGLDLYSFDLHPAARPTKVVLIEGSLVDKEGKPMGGNIEVKNEQTQQVTQLKADSSDGRFVAIVSAETTHRISVQSKGLAYASTTIDAQKLETQAKEAPRVELSSGPIKTGAAYRLQDIVFGTNSSELEPLARKNIEGFAEWLNKNPNLRVGIHGHTDNVGRDADNLALSQHRAKAVENYLISLGVDQERLQSEGFGPNKPIADNQTEAGRAKNRRTEFVILSE